MRSITRMLGGALLAACGAVGAAPWASATEPATALAANRGKVLVLPFTPLNQSEYQPWLGNSVQQSIVADLTVIAPARVLSGNVEAAGSAAAVDAGRKADAQFVVTGSFATAGQEIRIVGQVLDVNTGQPVTAIKATGSTDDIFAMEDQLAAQIRRRLALDPPARGDTPVATDEVPPMAPLHVAPQVADPYTQAYSTPAPNYGQTEYNYYLGNPYNNYGYGPGWGWGWFAPIWGFGFGYGYSCGYPCYRGGSSLGVSGGANVTWNGSYSAGVANSVNGTPLGGVGTLYAAAGTHSGAVGATRRGSAGFSAGVNYASGSVAVRARVGSPFSTSAAVARGGAPHRAAGHR